MMASTIIAPQPMAHPVSHFDELLDISFPSDCGVAQLRARQRISPEQWTAIVPQGYIQRAPNYILSGEFSDSHQISPIDSPQPNQVNSMLFSSVKNEP